MLSIIILFVVILSLDHRLLCFTLKSPIIIVRNRLFYVNTSRIRSKLLMKFSNSLPDWLGREVYFIFI